MSRVSSRSVGRIPVFPLSVDIERAHDSPCSYRDQLSTREKDYVIDAIDPQVRDSLEALNEFFTDPSWIKVSSCSSPELGFAVRRPSLTRMTGGRARFSTVPVPTLCGFNETLVSTSLDCSILTTRRMSSVRLVPFSPFGRFPTELDSLRHDRLLATQSSLSARHVHGL